ncbi:unnamed protein product [Closterium sp. Yama58-4]|nr:unnamed protein product [Closterium sp. Yama58-4]
MPRIASCPILPFTSAPPPCCHHARTLCLAANGYLPRRAAEATAELAERFDGGAMRCGEAGMRMGQLRRSGRVAEMARAQGWAERRQRGCGRVMTSAARGCWLVNGRGAQWTGGRKGKTIGGGRILASAEWGEGGDEKENEGDEDRGGGESESGSEMEGTEAGGSVGEAEGGGEGKGGSSGGGDESWEGRRRYMMVLAYDGTHFYGWQRQAQRPTVQGAVEAALATYTREGSAALGVTGASRTDAGVHAWGQVAHFTTASPICDLPRMHRALNALLPPAIRVRSLRAVPLSFHARLHACSKRYHYTVLNSPTPLLLPHRRSTLLSYPRGPLDRPLMAQAARLFEGRRDFAAFANTCEAKERGAVREITRFELVEEADCWQGTVDEGAPSPVFRFEVEGSGFLYRQVRNMVRCSVCGEMQHGEMHCGEMQCGGMQCGEMQCGEMQCGEMQCGEMHCGEMQCGGMQCGEMQCGEMHYGEMQCGEMQHGEMQCGEMQCGGMQCGEMQCGEMHYGEMQYGEMQCGEMHSGEMQYGEMQYGEMQCGGMQCGEMQCGEMHYGEMHYGEMQCGEMQCGEMQL